MAGGLHAGHELVPSTCERGPGIAGFLAVARQAAERLPGVDLAFVATSGHEIGREAPLVARVGYGTGSELAEGRWEEAVEVPHPERRQRRAEALRPQERLAAWSHAPGPTDAAIGDEDRLAANRVLYLVVINEEPHRPGLRLTVTLNADDDAAFVDCVAATRREDEWLGTRRDRLVGSARAAGRRAFEKGRQVADAAMDAAESAAREPVTR